MGSNHQLAGLAYDSRTREVWTASQDAPSLLSKQSGDLFLQFLNAPDHTLTRTEIRENLWGHDYVSEDTINHAVCRLRKALARINGNRNVVIETLPAMGYRLRGCEISGASPVTAKSYRRWLLLVSLFSLV